MRAAERAIVRQVRIRIKAGDRAGALVLLGRLDAPARRSMDLPGQTMFPFVVFRCERLGSEIVPVHVCVMRQAISDVQRNKDRSKGQGSDYPLCVTAMCAQGRALRDAVDPDRRIRWSRFGGPSGKMMIGSRHIVAQVEARRRLDAVGLLGDVPTVDSEPLPVESEEDGEARSQASNREPEREPESAAAARRAPLEAGAEREPERPSQGVRGVHQFVPRGGRSGSVQYPHGRDDQREFRAGGGSGGGTRPRVRLGEAEAGGRDQRAERAASGVGSASRHAARRDER